MPFEYDSFVDAIQFRLGSTTIDELHGLLLSKEIQLVNQRKTTSDSSTFQAFNSYADILPLPPLNPNSQSSSAFTTQGRGMDHNYNRGYSNRGNFISSYHGNTNRSINTNHRGNFHYNRGGRQHFSSYTKKTPCQICHQFDHEASDRPHRMNPAYGGKPSPSAMVANPSSSTPSWIVDSGATSYMTNSYAALQNPKVYTGPEQVYIGDGKGLPITHSGFTTLTTSDSTFKLNKVLYVPALQHNLLSANQFLIDNKCSMHLYPTHFTVKDLSSGMMSFKGPVQHGFYPFHFSSSTPAQQHALIAFVKASKDVWHQILGHHSVKIIDKLAAQSCISVLSHSTKSFCSDYALGKCSRLPFTSTFCTTSKPLELVHTDVWGPSHVAYCQDFRYYVIFVDDFTRYCWFYPLKYKSDVMSTFMQYKSLVETSLCTKIIVLRSDSGGEYVNTQFSQFLATHGIQHQLTCPHTPEQNGCAECKHRHLIETTRTMLAASKLPHTYWVEAFHIAIYLINRMPTASRPSP
ncbi:hypothetical protein FF2_008255 [Malus domestica]